MPRLSPPSLHVSSTMSTLRMRQRGESTRTALRRRAQIQRCAAQMQQTQQHHTTLQATDHDKSSTTRSLALSAVPVSVPLHAAHDAAVVPPPSSSLSSSTTTPRHAHVPASLHGNQTLQHRYAAAHDDASSLTAAQRVACDEVLRANSKAAAAATFLRLAQSDKHAVCAATFTAVVTSMLSHYARELRGVRVASEDKDKSDSNADGSSSDSGAVAACAHHVTRVQQQQQQQQLQERRTSRALVNDDDDDDDGSPDARWRADAPTSDEQRSVARYHITRLSRYAAKGRTYHATLQRHLEGDDGERVAQMEQQLRQHDATGMHVASDVVADLAQLDVSWQTALRLHTYVRTRDGYAPPAAMTERVMALMTGYRSDGIGSRPWQQALQLYESLVQSGYDVSLHAHTHALDALWRSADAFHRPGTHVTRDDEERVWQYMLRIARRVERAAAASTSTRDAAAAATTMHLCADATKPATHHDDEDNDNKAGSRDAAAGVVCATTPLYVSGDAGCAYMEALVKCSAAAGRWQAVLALLNDMDLPHKPPSHRMLLPTAETYAFAMAACNAAGHAAHATAILTMMQTTYTLRSMHAECLLIYLQSLRHVVRTQRSVGEQVEALVLDARGLDRPCTVVCLQLIAHGDVVTRTAKDTLAHTLLDYYDSNIWPHDTAVRDAELHTVFRCCYLIEQQVKQEGRPCTVMQRLHTYMSDVFGGDSREVRMLHATDVYALETTKKVDVVDDVKRRYYDDMHTRHADTIPVSPRQLRWLIARALLRCCRAADAADDDDTFLVDDDVRQQQQATRYKQASHAEVVIQQLYDKVDDDVPYDVVAELQLVQAACSATVKEQRRLGKKALDTYTLASARYVTPRAVDMLARALGRTEVHVSGMLTTTHAKMRANALQRSQQATTVRHNNICAASVLDIMYW